LPPIVYIFHPVLEKIGTMEAYLLKGINEICPLFSIFSIRFWEEIGSGSVFAEGYKIKIFPYLYIFHPVLERSGHSRYPDVGMLLLF